MIIFQVDRAAVKGYTGTGDPPCVVMMLEADSNKTTPPNLSLPVTLTGVRGSNDTILIERLAEGNFIFSKMYPDLTFKSKRASFMLNNQVLIFTRLLQGFDFYKGFFSALQETGVSDKYI